jgi:hypothetical protein
MGKIDEEQTITVDEILFKKKPHQNLYIFF